MYYSYAVIIDRISLVDAWKLEGRLVLLLWVLLYFTHSLLQRHDFVSGLRL
jgi:hypothetical protein